MAITKMGHMKEVKKGHPSSHLKNAIRYILNPEKTEGMLLVGGNSGVTAEEVYRTFLATKEEYGKLSGRQGYHFIISCRPGEATLEQIYQLVKRWCEEYLQDDYDYVFSIHKDHAHLHGHVVFNSVSRTTGYKYRYEKGDWEKTIQPITDRLCGELGLPKLIFEKEQRKTKHYAQWKAEKEKRPSARIILQADIDAAIQKAKDYPEFLSQMRKMGYELREGYSEKKKELYLTFYADGKKRGCRSYQLEEGYHVPDIIKRLQDKKINGGKKQGYSPNPSPIIRAWTSARIPYGKVRTVWYLTGLQFRYVKRVFRAGQIHSPYAVRNASYRRDIRRIHQISESCSYLMTHRIREEKELHKKHEELLWEMKQARDCEDEEMLRNLRGELRIVNRIRRDIKSCENVINLLPEKKVQSPDRNIKKGKVIHEQR